MSAYVVEDETINRVVGYLYELAATKQRTFWALEPLAKIGYDLGQAAQKGQSALADVGRNLAEVMHLLNVGAVRQRYEKADQDNMVGPMIIYRHIGHTRPIQVYKSLRCWLYQCSEGDVPESPLYKAMAEVADRIAAEIVSELPEYDTAPWA